MNVRFGSLADVGSRPENGPSHPTILLHRAGPSSGVKEVAPAAPLSPHRGPGRRLRVGAGGRKAWIVRTRAGGKPINKTLGTYPALGLADARNAARGLLIQ